MRQSQCMWLSRQLLRTHRAKHVSVSSKTFKKNKNEYHASCAARC